MNHESNSNDGRGDERFRETTSECVHMSSATKARVKIRKNIPVFEKGEKYVYECKILGVSPRRQLG